MKTYSRGSYAKFVFAMYALTILPFAIYPQGVVAQTNIFPQSGNAGIGSTSPPNPLTITRNGSTPYPSRPAYELLQLTDTTDNTPQIMFGSAHNGMFLRYTSTGYAGVNQRLSILNGGLVETFVVNNEGKVGIGIINPLFSLDVNGGINGFRAKASTASPLDAIAVFENANGIQAIVRGNGNVGIGTVNPTKTLDVTGDINASGTITGGTIVAKYQDVAEWVPSTHALAAGTVVTLDPTKSNHVEASSKAYDTRVAGVVSTQPGIALGEGGQGKVLVATTGRVRIKVDASHGPIEVGDLLVSSNVSGVAMKSKPIDVVGVEIHRPGTLIGKALEPLAKGQGEILVLLSLQ